MASTSAAVILTLTFLVVDKHLEEPTAPTALHLEEETKEKEALDSLAQLSNATAEEKVVDSEKGILLAVNPSLTETNGLRIRLRRRGFLFNNHQNLSPMSRWGHPLQIRSLPNCRFIRIVTT